MIPTLAVIAALTIFVVTEALDRAQYDSRVQLPSWLDQGGAADARDLLSATAGAIITTLGLVLSITVLTLQIASTQFGQRMLRRFMSDRGTQVSIGIFSATFVFSLLTLLSVVSRPGQREYVPWLSVWVSTLLAMSCIGVLIYFINHVAMSIQVNLVLAEIRDDLGRVVREPRNGSEPRMPGDLALPTVDFSLRVPASGYLQFIDYGALVALAEQDRVRIQFLVRPGQFLMEGAVVATGAYDDRAGRASEVPPRLAASFGRTLVLGSYRTLVQDPEFAIFQIVEIAVRAMSPAVNDPFTMLTCVDWLGDGLREIAQTPIHSPVHADPTGIPRVIEQPDRFEDLLAAAFDPLRQVARESPAATVRMFDTCAALAPALPTREQLAALRAEVELIHEGFDKDAVSRDRADVEAAYARAVRAIELSRAKLEAAL